jgi:hypothetical protein
VSRFARPDADSNFALFTRAMPAARTGASGRLSAAATARRADGRRNRPTDAHDPKKSGTPRPIPPTPTGARDLVKTKSVAWLDRRVPWIG